MIATLIFLSALHSQSDLAIANVADIKGVSKLGFAVGYPTLDMLLLSDDGKILVQHDDRDVSAMESKTGALLWSISLAGSVVAPTDDSAISSDTYLPVACPDEGRLLCVRHRASDSNPTSASRAGAITMLTIQPKRAASVVTTQTWSFGVPTGLLESKVSQQGVRLVITKGKEDPGGLRPPNTGGTVGFATLSDRGLISTAKDELTPQERKLLGLVIPLCEPGLPKTLRTFPTQKTHPTSSDIEHGLIAYRHGDSYFDAFGKRFVKLPKQEKGWRIESTAARGRVWAWTSWTPTEAKPNLYVTTRGGTWKRVGNFQLAGRSANGKFLLLHQPKRISATPGKFLLVELK